MPITPGAHLIAPVISSGSRRSAGQNLRDAPAAHLTAGERHHIKHLATGLGLLPVGIQRPLVAFLGLRFPVSLGAPGLDGLPGVVAGHPPRHGRRQEARHTPPGGLSHRVPPRSASPRSRHGSGRPARPRAQAQPAPTGQQPGSDSTAPSPPPSQPQTHPQCSCVNHATIRHSKPPDGTRVSRSGCRPDQPLDLPPVPLHPQPVQEIQARLLNVVTGPPKDVQAPRRVRVPSFTQRLQHRPVAVQQRQRLGYLRISGNPGAAPHGTPARCSARSPRANSTNSHPTSGSPPAARSIPSQDSTARSRSAADRSPAAAAAAYSAAQEASSAAAADSSGRLRRLTPPRSGTPRVPRTAAAPAGRPRPPRQRAAAGTPRSSPPR